MDLRFLTSPLIGAVIGYFTNWLAIKMLFRPHTEKRIFGIKVPFTPGIIPKEKARLSSKVGETVGKYLVTTEVLQKNFENSDMELKINTKIQSFIDNTAQSEKTIDECLDKFLDNKSSIVNNIQDKAKVEIRSFLTSSKFKRQFSETLVNSIITKLQSVMIKDIYNDSKDTIKSLLKKYKDEYVTEDYLRIVLYDEFDNAIDKLEQKNYKLSDIINPSDTEKIQFFISNNLFKISVLLEDLLKNNPDLDKKLEILVSKIIDENINKLLGLFLNNKKVYESIKKSTFEFFSDEKNITITNEKASELTSYLLNKDLNTLLPLLDGETVTNLKEKLIAFILKYDETIIIDKLITKTDEFVLKYDSYNLYTIITKLKPSIYDYIYNTIYDYVSNYIDNNLYIIDTKVNDICATILNLKIKDIVAGFGVDNLNTIKTTITSNTKPILVKASEYISNNIDIPTLVEEQINKLDFNASEKIILSVVDKELKAITVLGGVLGFVIGFVFLFI